MEESHWMHAIRKGDKEPFQDIAEKYYDDIYRFCAFQVGSREDAYDLAQETFLRFIRYAESYHDRNLKGYLLTIAMNVCRNYLRRRGREEAMALRWEPDRDGGMARKAMDMADVADRARQETDESIGQMDSGSVGPGPEQYVVERDIHDRLMAALAQLPQMQREAVLLHYLYDMKYREIGRVTGTGIATVKSRVRQGMDKLQGILRREDFL